MKGSAFNPAYVSHNQKRAFYNFLRKLSVFTGKVITEGELVLIAPLVNTSEITFSITQASGGALLPGEKQLLTSDAFWAMEHFFGIAKVVTGETTAQIQTETFPNEYVFANAAENLALRGLYFDGDINLVIDNTVYLDQFGVSNFECADLAARDLAISANATVNLVPRSKVNKQWAWNELTPHVLLNGDFTNKLSIKLSAPQNMASPAGAVNYGVYKFRGFTIQGGAAKTPQIKAALEEYSRQFN